MKQTKDKQLEFIKLRAEGLSYDKIAKTMGINKTTCIKWEKDLTGQIDEQKRLYLQELLESYSMSKEGRIKALGDTIEKINQAISKADFSKTDPVRLLEVKLKYMETLSKEYAGIAPAIKGDITDGKSILAALGDLLDRVRGGDIPSDQAQRETGILVQMIRAFDTVEVKAKVDELEAIIGSR